MSSELGSDEISSMEDGGEEGVESGDCCKSLLFVSSDSSDNSSFRVLNEYSLSEFKEGWVPFDNSSPSKLIASGSVLKKSL